jgi:hypothetical protein
MMDEVVKEIYRTRWRRARGTLGLVDPGQDGFATGGLGRHVPHLTVRLLVLPADPEVGRIEFDEPLWNWWKSAHQSPFEESPTDWGNSLLPTSSAAVRCVSLAEEKWDSYLALPRYGGLDMGLGPEGGAEREAGRVFWLVRIVGRLWAALHLYREVVARFDIVGPWECSVALVKTRGGNLGNFGSGWAEYPDPRANPRACSDPNLLSRRELIEWPNPDETRSLAFGFGAWIEDSWGMQCRRFLACSGPLAGEFDRARYR